MPSLMQKKFSWSEEAARLLRACQKAAPRGLSEAAALRWALARAAGCRCEEHAALLEQAKRFGTERREPVAPMGVLRSNPLRSLREAAGLQQKPAAARLGITRGALSTAENRANVSADFLERARAAYARKAP